MGAVIGGAASLRMPETYASSATLRMPSTDEDFWQPAQQALAAEPLDVKIRTAVYIEALVDAKTRSTMLTVKVADHEPDEARQVTERLLGRVLTANGMYAGSIRTARAGPNRPAVAGGGAAIGLLFSALAMHVRRGTRAES